MSQSVASKPQSGRPALKRQEIVSALRTRIVTGKLPAGSRIPTRLELRAKFDTGPATVQQAIDLLVNDGFLVSRGYHGTFVASDLPHLSQTALVFPEGPRPVLNLFFAALAEEATRRQQTDERHLSLWYGHEGRFDRGDYARLISEQQRCRLAGVIFASNPYQLEDSPLITDPDLRRVTIKLLHAGSPVREMPAIEPDYELLIDQVLDYCVSRGRKRVAILCRAQWYGALQEHLHQAIASRGLTVLPQWVQFPDVEPISARHCALGLMHGKQRPESLFIADDNLAASGVAGLLDAGAHIPQELEVITHCNLPSSIPMTVPVRRIGFNVSQIIDACFQMLDHASPGEVRKVPPVFENEDPLRWR